MLSEWIKVPENESIFDEYIKTHYEITVFMNDPNVENIKRDLLKRIKKDKNPFSKNNYIQLFKYAAIVVLFFGLGYIYQKSRGDTNQEVVNENVIVPKEEFITVQLDNGNIKVISEEGNDEIINANGLVIGKQRGNILAYGNTKTGDKLIYNTLTVPYGKRFQVVLSDGTKVHLNAGTSLKYPVKFLNGLSREVFLDGEAFFDVVKDTKHPFLVNTKSIDVKVLGTKFNVTSYPEDDFINTVLVEGAVEVFENNQDGDSNPSAILKPGYIATWNKQDKNITVEKADIEQYTAWMNGRLILNEVPFESIQKKLERQYNVIFVNNNKALNGRKFTARFDIESINQVMQSLSISASFNYTVVNNQIIIN